MGFEGEEEMRKLQQEVSQIVQSNDLMRFEAVGKELEITGVNEQSLKVMSEVILNFDKDPHNN